MIYYRVENPDALVKEFKKEGVIIVDGNGNYEYGKFVHILDGKANRARLWEATHKEYKKLVLAETK